MTQKKILIADNDPSTIAIFEFIVNQLGYTAIATQNARRCQEIIAQNPSLSVAFIDMSLKDFPHIEWVKETLKTHPTLHILLMTGYGVDNILTPAFDAGIYGILYKPFDVEEVLTILETIFSHTTKNGPIT